MRRFTPKIVMRYAVQGAALAVIAAIGVTIFYTDPATFEHLRRVGWGMKAWLLAAIVFAWLCNGTRVFLLTHSLGYRLRYIQCLSVSLSSEFGIAATPAGMGGAAIRLTLLKRAGVSLAHGASMLAMDVALDSLFFLLLLPFAALSLARNPKIHLFFRGVDSAALLAAILLVVLVIASIVKIVTAKNGDLYILFRWISSHSALSRRRLPARLRMARWKATSGWRQMTGGFIQLLHLRWGSVLLTFACASMQWICRYSVLPLLLYSLSIPCDPVLLFFLQGLLFTGSLLVVLPGGGGGVEVGAAIVLRQVIPPYLVGIVVLLWRFFTYHMYLLGGGSMFLWTCAHFKSLFPSNALENGEEIAFENPDEE